jgi:predicted hydrocarbon binding protein
MRLLSADPYLDRYHRPGHGGRQVIHSEHYNVALLRTVLSAERIDARSLVESAAAELAFGTLRAAGEPPHPDDRAGRWWEAAALFEESGLGTLEWEGELEQGGEVRVAGSHFACGWSARHGRSKTPVCAVPVGYLRGALAAVYGARFEVVETQCRAQGKPGCRFRVSRVGGEVPRAAVRAVEEGSAPGSAPPHLGRIDEAAVVTALFGGAGGEPVRNERLGGAVSNLWADFYSRVSYGFEREIPRCMGSKFATLPALVLVEAGHASAFHTFGRIMSSRDWRERVAPLLTTREDWLHAAIAVVNTFGWGTWRVRRLVPGEAAAFRVYDSYEAAGFRREFGAAPSSKCYFSRGFAAALMNLVYVGDISRAPELSQSYYNHLFRSPLSFRAAETRCRAMDDTLCELVVNPLSPGLSGRFFDDLRLGAL